ncbi:hypothetical protein AMK32_35515 [Streptomyces sp. CB01883]|nr:hypothetical protein AMK32_35515 [Streptomyces sp. CB01883]
MWQDADGGLHVFGIDGKNTLAVIHQQGFAQGDGNVLRLRWTQAETTTGTSTTVIVGLHAKIASYFLDPYPDYRPNELITMAGMLPSESFCICTQDLVSGIWSMDKVRRASTGDPHLVSHYVADVTLLDSNGTSVPNYPFSVSADTLVEIQIDSRSYLVGPGRSADAVTGPLGKATVSLAARGLTPATVTLTAEGVAGGATVDFAQPVNNYLAGKGGLPSQKGVLNRETMRDAEVTDAKGNKERLVPDWQKIQHDFDLDPQRVVDHCHSVYGMAAGEKALPKMMIDGYAEPQQVAGYVIQFWDRSRPAFQAFRTREEVLAYEEYRNSHPAYGGWWDDFTNWASDVWEGIKTGATKIAEIVVDTIVKIAVKIGEAIVSLGELIVETVVEAARAVEAVFQAIADAVLRAIDWLKSLFAFGDIWDTKVALEQAFQKHSAIFTATVKNVHKDVAKWLDSAEEEFEKVLDSLTEQYRDTRMGDFGNKVPPSSDATGRPVEASSLSNDPQAGWLCNKTFSSQNSAALAQATTRGLSPGDKELIDEFSGIMTTLVSPDLSDLFTRLGRLFNSLTGFYSVDTGSGADRSAFDTLVEMLRTLVEAGMKAIRALVEKVFTFAEKAAARIWDLIDEPLDIPLISTLYEWLHQQARPGEPPEQMTLGRLITLIAAFFGTVIYKLINGVDNPPFKGATVPDPPLPSWDSRCGRTQRTETNWDEHWTFVELQGAFGLFAAVIGGLGTGLSDWSLHARGNEKAMHTRLINVLEIIGSVCSLIFTYPPYMGDDDWEDHPLVKGAWATAVIKASFDAVGTGLGHLIPKLERSSLLKNAGGALEHVHKMLEGSALQLVFGCVTMGLSVEGIKKYPPPNDQLKSLTIASSVLTSTPDILQVARAVVTHVVPNTPTSDWTIKVVAVLDGLLIASGNACLWVPATMVYHDGKPKIGGTPDEATIGTAYQWTPTVSGAIGTRAFSTPRTFEFQNLPAWLSGDADTGRIHGTPPAGSTDATFTVTASDAYLPAQGATMQVTVPVKSKKSPTQPVPPRRRR